MLFKIQVFLNKEGLTTYNGVGAQWTGSQGERDIRGFGGEQATQVRLFGFRQVHVREQGPAVWGLRIGIYSLGQLVGARS